MGALIEICVEGPDGALAAQEGGANRVELCSSLAEGGVTPSWGSIELVRALLSIDLAILIRPRSGDFLYSKAEFEAMKLDIRRAREAGAHGVVLGILRENGAIDIDRTAELIEAARPLSVTFHRGFDLCRDPREGLHDLIRLGADRVLTSGHAPSAAEGLALIREMVDEARDRISIMPGGGVNEENIRSIVDGTRAREVHLSASAFVESPTRREIGRPQLGRGGPTGENQRRITDLEKVRRCVAALRNP